MFGQGYQVPNGCAHQRAGTSERVLARTLELQLVLNGTNLALALTRKPVGKLAMLPLSRPT